MANCLRVNFLRKKRALFGQLRVLQNPFLPLHSAAISSQDFRAGPACVNTFIHISDALAVIRAFGANRGTNATGFLVQIRVAHEELRAGLANFRAKQRQPQVLGCDMFASHFKTMGGSHGKTRAIQSRQFSRHSCISVDNGFIILED
jgi:hypothetical protein